MTKEQYILLKIIEEAAEVQQQASKCMRFGMNFARPADGKVNKDLLKAEWSDLMHAMQRLIDLGSITTEWDLNAQWATSVKFDKYYEISKELGFVE